MSSDAGLLHRVVGDDADHDALDAAEADDQVAGEQRVHLEEIAVVDQPADDAVHVHRLRRIGLGEVVHPVVLVHQHVVAEMVRRILGVVGRQEAQQLAGDARSRLVVLGDEVDVAADRRVHHGAADVVHA